MTLEEARQLLIQAFQHRALVVTERHIEIEKHSKFDLFKYKMRLSKERIPLPIHSVTQGVHFLLMGKIVSSRGQIQVTAQFVSTETSFAVGALDVIGTQETIGPLTVHALGKLGF